MRKLLVLLLLAPCALLAQVPNYVPTDGLVAWFPFAGDAENEIPGYSQAQPINDFEYITSSAGTPFIRIHGNDVNGLTGGAILFEASELIGSSEMTISLWCNLHEILHPHGERILALGRAQNEFAIVVSPGEASCFRWPYSTDAACGDFTLAGTGWHHHVLTIGTDSIHYYFDGALVGSHYHATGLTSLEPLMALGAHWWDISSSTRIEADFMNVGVWHSSLSINELEALFAANPVGCTDTNACNYNADAVSDDGSCYSCDIPAAHCGPGTHWDSTLAACVADVPGAEVAENCALMSLQELSQGYLNLLETVSLQDSLLNACQGDTASSGGSTDPATDPTAWSCGDPLLYQGYDYATVQIGDQCWFAENLRTQQYENGDPIESGLTDGEWITTTTGATATYGETGNCTNDYSPSYIDACNPTVALVEYGRLYNWFAVDDNRNLCPSNWHVPTDQEWSTMVTYLGSMGFSGNEGTALKSTSGWYNNGNGTDNYGFAAVPSGHRLYENGTFRFVGDSNQFWSSSQEGGFAWRRYLVHGSSTIQNGSRNPRNGFSVRCIRN